VRYPRRSRSGRLASEQQLEEMIVADSRTFIGRQQTTPVGGCLDLLAFAPDGSLASETGIDHK